MKQMIIENSDFEAMQLLEKCISNGIFSEYSEESDQLSLLDEDLLESGLMDSMSLTMLDEMIKQEYEVEIDYSIFIAELRSLRKIASYIEGTQQ